MRTIRWVVALAFVFVILPIALGVLALSAGRDMPVVASGAQLRVVRVSSGLLARQSFANHIPERDLMDEFEFNGDAPPGVGYVRAPGGGLQVGVLHHGGNTFQGWFAVPYRAYPAGGVYHARVMRQDATATGTDQAEAVFAVQTASTKLTGLINYVVVDSHSSGGTTVWEIGYAHGKVANAKTDVYWSRPDSALSQDVTVRTDGSRSLTVWFGDEQVFSAGDLDMDIQPPFQPYLEVQSVHMPYLATFTDYWITGSDAVTFSGAGPHAAVCLTSASGAAGAAGAGTAPLACAPADEHGTVVLRLPPPRCLGTATVTVKPQGGDPMSVPGVGYSCGSTYALSPVPTTG